MVCMCRYFSAEGLGCLVVPVIYSDVGRDGQYFVAIAFDGVVSLCVSKLKFENRTIICFATESYGRNSVHFVIIFL